MKTKKEKQKNQNPQNGGYGNEEIELNHGNRLTARLPSFIINPF
jgi:hypothetical protein